MEFLKYKQIVNKDIEQLSTNNQHIKVEINNCV